MPQTYIAFGDPIEGRAPDEFSVKAARETWRVIEARREFTFVEVRRVASDGGVAEALVVDCKNDEVATRNRVGIRYCERLALIFYTNPERQPEVRALRNGFPVTAHQNYVVAGEPPSLCLYFEPWSRVRRSWTPQFHLNRILWWLAETANGTLHRPDQPLEQLYFDSPFELVLLWDFRAKIADPNYQLAIRSHKERELKATLIGQMIDRGGSVSGAVGIACLALTVPPIVHGRVEAFPATLGALDDQFQRRGAALIEGLADQNSRTLPSGPLRSPGIGSYPSRPQRAAAARAWCFTRGDNRDRLCPKSKRRRTRSDARGLRKSRQRWPWRGSSSGGLPSNDLSRDEYHWRSHHPAT